MSKLEEKPLTLKKELGLLAASSLVIGNMIGSGIFMTPQSLASSSNPKSTLIAWIITSIGSILLALSFANLGVKMPRTAGPVVYTREAFGDFAGFTVNWGYWIGIMVGDAAIITTATSYLSYFFPIINENGTVAFLISSSILWIFTIINIRGTKAAGFVGIITTLCKFIPLIIFIILASMKFDLVNFATVSSDSVSDMKTIPIAISITLWAFLGLESAAVVGGEIKNPEKNIKRSTVYGTILTSIIYIIISGLAIGAMPQNKIAASSSPMADIIDYATGSSWGGTLIAIGAIVACVGTISGWIMLSGRSAYGAAEEKLLPELFKKVHPIYQTPYIALIFSSIITNIVLITNYVNSLTDAFNFIILLSTMVVLPIYTFTAASEVMLLYKKSENFNILNLFKNSFLSLVAFGYSVYAIFGTGYESISYGFILLLLGIPLYVYLKIQQH